jgi:hypothetical protein
MPWSVGRVLLFGPGTLPGFVLAASVLASGAAAAQSPAPGPRWEIEVHGGAIRATNPTDGTTAVPSARSLAPNGSRPVSSWYFGDGASQLTQATSIRQIAPNVSLDPVLQSRFVRRRSSGTVGLRVSRELTRRFAAELTLDYNPGTLALTNESASGLEAARAGFVTAWNGVFSGGSFTSRTASSVATISDRTGRQVMTTGTVLVNLMPAARLAPYVTVGAGAISNRGATPRAALAGDHQFALSTPPGFPNPSPTFRQTDSVTVRSETGSGLGLVVGAGLKYAAARRWGVRVDVRDILAANRHRTLVDATPAPASLTPFGTLTLFAFNSTNTAPPPLVFSGAPNTSTLSGPQISGFETFKGTGIEHHVHVTAGLFWRF